MGVLYVVAPLSEDMVDWLDDHDILYPPSEAGRPATPREVRRAVDRLTGYAVEEFGPHTQSGCWQLDITSEPSPEEGGWTLLNVRGYTGLDDPCEIGFEKGWPEPIVEIVHHLCRDTGPLVVVPDTGCPPAVVWRGRSVEETISSWKHVNP